jgi:hypothetical protein
MVGNFFLKKKKTLKGGPVLLLALINEKLKVFDLESVHLLDGGLL